MPAELPIKETARKTISNINVSQEELLPILINQLNPYDLERFR